MSKDPAILFYTQDFLVGTMLMTDDQKGKYITLLCLQHQKGRLTEKDMLNICKTYDKDIFDKFIQNGDGLFYNERLEKEATKRKMYSESRRNNRLMDKKEDLENNISKTYDKHMENENENEDNNINIVFENFRKLYPGTKRGYLTEFENFKKKNKDWKDVLPKLNDSLNEQIKARNRKKSMNGFVPEWKHLQTYLNNRCWEEEITIKNEQTSKSLM